MQGLLRRLQAHHHHKRQIMHDDESFAGSDSMFDASMFACLLCCLAFLPGRKSWLLRIASQPAQRT
jgi:hypothetical protein